MPAFEHEEADTLSLPRELGGSNAKLPHGRPGGNVLQSPHTWFFLGIVGVRLQIERR